MDNKFKLDMNELIEKVNHFIIYLRNQLEKLRLGNQI